MPFTIRFPIPVAGPATRTPTVLVMSEDPEWLAVVRRVLEHERYRVLAARHPGEALVESIRHEGELDLLLTDGDQGQRPGGRFLSQNPKDDSQGPEHDVQGSTPRSH